MGPEGAISLVDADFKGHTSEPSWAVFRNTYGTAYGTYFNWGWRSTLKWTSKHLGIYKKGRLVGHLQLVLILTAYRASTSTYRRGQSY